MSKVYKVYRTLIRVERDVLDGGEELIDIVIPAWKPSIPILKPPEFFTDEILAQVREHGTFRTYGYVNLDADSARDLVVEFIPEETEQAADELKRAREALKQSGIGGIYDQFRDIPDAVSQMTHYIKDLEKRIWGAGRDMPHSYWKRSFEIELADPNDD